MDEERYFRYKRIFDIMDKSEATGIAFKEDIRKKLKHSAITAYPIFNEHPEACITHLHPIIETYTREVFDCYDLAYSRNVEKPQYNVDNSPLSNHIDFYKRELALHKELKKVLVKHYQDDILNFDGVYIKMLDRELFTTCTSYYMNMSDLFGRRTGALHHLIAKDDTKL